MRQLLSSRKSPRLMPDTLRTAFQVAIIGISSVAVLSGCQATRDLFGRVDDGTLDYQKAEKLEPLQLPADKETAPFVPLYPTPHVGVNTIDTENKSGQRYDLPPPYRQVPVTEQAN